MRLAVAVLCVLALMGSANAEADRSCLTARQPPMRVGEPSVPYQVYRLPLRDLPKACGYPDLPVQACISSTPQANGTWTIIIKTETSGLDEYACLLRYEKSHLAPYFWGDPSIETPQVIKWLADQKAAYLKGQTSP